MPFVQTHKLNIHYEVADTGKVILVLVHGNFASWRWWRPVLERLPSGYSAYAPDLRGCGDTDRPRSGHTIRRLASDLHDFAEALSLPPFHLVGHSLGGSVALEFAFKHSELLQSLTLVAPPPAEGMSHSQGGNNNSSSMSGLASLGTSRRLLRNLGVNRSMLRMALMSVTPTLARDHNFEAMVSDAGRMCPEAIDGLLRSLEKWNARTKLRKLRLPILILGGELDKLIPPASLQGYAKSRSNRRLIVWPNVGHAPQLEDPDRFLRLLIKFVDENSTEPIVGIRRRLSHLWGKIPRIRFLARTNPEWPSSKM